MAFAQKSRERSVTASLRIDFCTKSTLQPVFAICLTIFASMHCNFAAPQGESPHKRPSWMLGALIYPKNGKQSILTMEDCGLLTSSAEQLFWGTLAHFGPWTFFDVLNYLFRSIFKARGQQSAFLTQEAIHLCIVTHLSYDVFNHLAASNIFKLCKLKLLARPSVLW